MERLTHKRENGIKRGYWSPNKKQELVDRLAMYEDREDAKDTNVLGKWIPCSEKLPEDESYILVSFENATMPDIARYEETHTREEFRALGIKNYLEDENG